MYNLNIVPPAPLTYITVTRRSHRHTACFAVSSRRCRSIPIQFNSVFFFFFFRAGPSRRRQIKLYHCSLCRRVDAFTYTFEIFLIGKSQILVLRFPDCCHYYQPLVSIDLQIYNEHPSLRNSIVLLVIWVL